MGALCGKEDHFDSLGSQGNKLGSSSAPLARTPTPHEPRRKPPVAVGSAGRKLGGSGEGGGGGTSGGPDREAMLRAAEQRSKAVCSLISLTLTDNCGTDCVIRYRNRTE